MLERSITEKLDNWLIKNKDMAFILDGARQVGKTYLLNWFCETHFKSSLSVNLSKESLNFNIINKATSVSDYLNYFKLISKNTLVPGESVIYIDEIQLMPKLLTAIKFLVIDGTYRYILSGTMIDHAFRLCVLTPMGYCVVHKMYPLSFREFLLANDVDKSVIEEIGKSLIKLSPIPDSYIDQFDKLFNVYLTTGGMPEVVASYLEKKDLSRVLEIQKKIIYIYQHDITRCQEESNKPLLMKIYNKIPSQLLKSYNRYYLNQLKENCRYSEVVTSIYWLTMLRTTLRVDISDDLNDDFIIVEHEKFKLYLNDVGLLAASYNESYKFESIEDFKNNKLKSLYQNFVCQELTYAGEYIRCFNNKKNGEIEFILTVKSTGTPIPIVIKTGTYYKTHKSLNYAIKSNKSIKRAFVLCNSNIQAKGKIEYLPVWCMGLFPRENNKHIPLLRIPKLVV